MFPIAHAYMTGNALLAAIGAPVLMATQTRNVLSRTLAGDTTTAADRILCIEIAIASPAHWTARRRFLHARITQRTLPATSRADF
jgi:hypothetical protein